MIRSMKFHIYNENHEPLLWDDKVLEFDTFTDASSFLNDCGLEEEAVIVEDILYYDGGYLNATNLRIKNDELIEIKKE